MLSYLNVNNTITPSKSEFMPGDSTVNQLASVYHDLIMSHHSSEEQPHNPLLSHISKAFDRMWHKGITKKKRRKRKKIEKKEEEKRGGGGGVGGGGNNNNKKQLVKDAIWHYDFKTIYKIANKPLLRKEKFLNTKQ